MKHPSSTDTTGVAMIDLPVLPLDQEFFAPFGQVIAPTVDGKLFDQDDAQLDLHRGTPRLYMMQLERNEHAFRSITRHLSVTQCLAAMEGKSWLIAVAPADDPDNPAAMPDPQKLKAFRVPGNMAIKLHRSVWHAGPFTDDGPVNFLNLELSDTNQTDHFSCKLDQVYGLAFRLIA